MLISYLLYCPAKVSHVAKAQLQGQEMILYLKVERAWE